MQIENQLKLECCSICGSENISSFIKTTSMMHDGSGTFNFDQCADCENVFLNPRVPFSDLKEYYSKFYLPYRGAEAWGKFARFVERDQRKTDQKRAKVLAQNMDIFSDTVILDLGCGKPSFLEVCQKKFNCHAYGIDFSDKGWKDSNSRFKNLHLSVGDVDSIPENLKPDILSMWHYLEHDYNPKDTLKKLASLAKPSSKLFIEVPNFNSESRIKYGKNWAGYHSPRHTYLFSPDNIKKLLKDCGWELTHLDLQGTLDPYNLYWMSEMEIKQINWQKNMETEFWGYVKGMLKFNLKRFFETKKSHGVMTLVAKKSPSMTN